LKETNAFTKEFSDQRVIPRNAKIVKHSIINKKNLATIYIHSHAQFAPNLFFIRFTLFLVRGGDLILKTLSLKETFTCNVEGDISISLTISGGFVGIKSIPGAAIKKLHVHKKKKPIFVPFYNNPLNHLI